MNLYLKGLIIFIKNWLNTNRFNVGAFDDGRKSTQSCCQFAPNCCDLVLKDIAELCWHKMKLTEEWTYIEVFHYFHQDLMENQFNVRALDDGQCWPAGCCQFAPNCSDLVSKDMAELCWHKMKLIEKWTYFEVFNYFHQDLMENQFNVGALIDGSQQECCRFVPIVATWFRKILLNFADIKWR